MNIISDQGPISTSNDDINGWENSFPKWNKDNEAQEWLNLDDSQTNNTNSAHRKVKSGAITRAKRELL
jgi:hypothetical protein